MNRVHVRRGRKYIYFGANGYGRFGVVWTRAGSTIVEIALNENTKMTEISPVFLGRRLSSDQPSFVARALL